MKIILASESPRRKKILQDLGLSFEVMPSNADEKSVYDSDPARLVQKIAYLKAASVAKKVTSDSLIIAADTIVWFRGKVIGKPKNIDDARRMMRMLSGKEHCVYTGLCIIDKPGIRQFRSSERTKVRFRKLTDTEIEEYIVENPVLGMAGAYAIQSRKTPVESIKGSFYNVVGLPLEMLVPILLENGIECNLSNAVNSGECL
jgi:septum formation protein